MRKTRAEIQARALYIALGLFISMFLFLPIIKLFSESLGQSGTLSFINYREILLNEEIRSSILNSIKVSALSAVLTTTLGFTIAYAVNCTNIPKKMKSIIRVGVIVPMLFPTITYGFAIIYSLGKQGLITKLVGIELIEIYGFKGLLIGYFIYTLPIVFLLIDNSFHYVDKKFMLVSKLMGDNQFRTFKNTVIRPMVGTLGGAFILSFVLSFTDFGIPASLGGTYEVVSIKLYQIMLGAIPDFGKGAALAVIMLFPAGLGVFLLTYLEKFSFRYEKISEAHIFKNKLRDISLGAFSLTLVLSIISVFLVIFISPVVKNFPYDLSWDFSKALNILSSQQTIEIYQNSLLVAILTGVLGTIVSYLAALLNTRTNLKKKFKVGIDGISMITNTVPGMVLGVSYLLLFNSTSLKGSFAILIICNIVHFFTTPYLMAKNCLSKMNSKWEVTAELMGDSWIKTVIRIIIPNSMSTIIEMLFYYFINAMITISAVIFLVSARTSLLTSKIKELQHYANFNEVFVLSMLIFFTNVVFKIGGNYFSHRLNIKMINPKEMTKNEKKN